MSSPIASRGNSIIRKIFKDGHQKVSHSNRVKILADSIRQVIGANFDATKPIKGLDVGCGDMKISELISESMPCVNWTCIDIHPLPNELSQTEKWQKYLRFDGKHFNFKDNCFDFVLFSDVLHHDNDNIVNLLKEAARVSNNIIIKDHFESSIYERQILKLLDFAGNWAYGIKIPERYFSKPNFFELCASLNLKVEFLKQGIDLYGHIPLLNKLVPADLQFIALVKRGQRDS